MQGAGQRFLNPGALGHLDRELLRGSRRASRRRGSGPSESTTARVKSVVGHVGAVGACSPARRSDSCQESGLPGLPREIQAPAVCGPSPGPGSRLQSALRRSGSARSGTSGRFVVVNRRLKRGESRRGGHGAPRRRRGQPGSGGWPPGSRGPRAVRADPALTRAFICSIVAASALAKLPCD